MEMSGCVTIEWSVGFVRLHDQPAKFGEFAPFDDGFAVVQVEPGIFEAKIARGTVLTTEQHRDLREQMESMGAQAVFYWRFKEGRPPYKVWIARREIAQKSGD
jgi:hypothetical protein